MKQKINSEKDDDVDASDLDGDVFDEEISAYFGNFSDCSLTTKRRRQIEDLLEEKKLKDEFDDFIDF